MLTVGEKKQSDIFEMLLDFRIENLTKNVSSGEKLSFLPDEPVNDDYPSNSITACSKHWKIAFGKGGRESIYIFSSKERSGEIWKRISKLET
ncbi:hypothetical protein CDAR_572221 [Caerostris darwini]|uniref:Uncharacterized protein n=1 Tax=Caerostris darwini TaxID=1538125 RepID=A0AAV4PFS3_9ARAC|nr:hypothetical protein CDAR_572221 [Caerostris darwini]